MNVREPRVDVDRLGPVSKSTAARYGFAVLAAIGSVAAAAVFLDVSDTPVYSLMVGAVAIAVWYGGFGPGLVCVAIAWSVAYVLFVGDAVAVDTGTDDELLLWAASLIVALGVVWISLVMRRGQERAASAAVAAEASVRDLEAVQELAGALSAAVTQADVAHTLVALTPPIIGARGGAVGLLDGDELVILDPEAVATQTHAPGTRLPLTVDAPIVRAVTSAARVVVRDPETLRSLYPDAIAMTPYVRAAVAVPLRVAGKVVGSVSFLFDREHAMHEDAAAIAAIAGDLGAQALERSRLFDDEQLLRTRSERLQGMTAELSNALTRADVAEVLAGAVAEATGAAGTAVALVVEDRRLVRTLVSHGYADDVVERQREISLDDATAGNQVIRRCESAFYETSNALRDAFPRAARMLDGLEHDAFLFVPLVARRRANGLLVISWVGPRTITPAERRFVEALAGQAAQALDRAGHYESEQTIAETLQRSVLPTSLPRVQSAQIAARYLPGTAELDVGGDWFDAIPLSDGRVGLVVGDVVGKGVQAAATMAQLRNALRAFAFDRMKPASTLARLSRLAEESLETTFATLLYAVVDPSTRVCRFASAGHPPPLVAFPDGRVELLEGGRGLPLGAGAEARYTQDVVELPVGSLLLLYTDGLVERRERSIDSGLALLVDAVREGPRHPEQLVEHVLEQLIGTSERGDDVALLAFRLLAVAPDPLLLEVPIDLASLDLVRDTLRVWLEGSPATREQAQDTVLATWEACANAVEHAQQPTGDAVTVRAALEDGKVTVVVEDTGRWKPTREPTDRGFGLRLMRSVMSSVHIEPGEAGTRVTLERTLEPS